MQLIEGGHICFHKTEAAATGSTTFLSQNFFNAVCLDYFLNSGFTQTGDLSAFVRTKILGVERKSSFAGSFGNDQGNAQAAFPQELWVVLAECLEFLGCGAHSELSGSGGFAVGRAPLAGS